MWRDLLILVDVACLCVWLPILWICVSAGPGVLSALFGVPALFMAALSTYALFDFLRR